MLVADLCVVAVQEALQEALSRAAEEVYTLTEEKKEHEREIEELRCRIEAVCSTKDGLLRSSVAERDLRERLEQDLELVVGTLGHKVRMHSR